VKNSLPAAKDLRICSTDLTEAGLLLVESVESVASPPPGEQFLPGRVGKKFRFLSEREKTRGKPLSGEGDLRASGPDQGGTKFAFITSNGLRAVGNI